MPKNLPQKSTKDVTESFMTPLEEAIVEIKKRREDTALIQRVYDYLEGDIPEHFNREQPILYLSRHIATPNYEALRFVELGKPHGLPLVIGQDRKGKFVSHNTIKRPLGKMPVTKGFSRLLDEIIENFTVIDFSEAQGRQFADITTKKGSPLVDFHNELFKNVYSEDVEIAEEADWIDRNFRHDLLEQYKRMLALMCAHGIMLESYPEYEQDFVEAILKPAMQEVEIVIGCKPLIVEHISPELEITRDWNGYPSVLYQFVKQHLEDK